MTLRPIIYTSTGDEVRVGDKVTIKRTILPDVSGIVSYVHDPNREYVVKGDNEVGFAVRIKKYEEYWFGGDAPRKVGLRERGKA